MTRRQLRSPHPMFIISLLCPFKILRKFENSKIGGCFKKGGYPITFFHTFPISPFTEWVVVLILLIYIISISILCVPCKESILIESNQQICVSDTRALAKNHIVFYHLSKLMPCCIKKHCKVLVISNLIFHKVGGGSCFAYLYHIYKYSLCFMGRSYSCWI